MEFQLMALAVTVDPCCDQVADQPSVTCCPAGKLKLRVQLLMVDDPVLVMVTLAVKPGAPPQSFVE